MARPTKVCCACGRARLLSSYNKHAHHKDGLNSKCRECERKYRKQNPHIGYGKSDRYYRARKQRDYTHWNLEWHELVWSEMQDQCRRLEKITGTPYHVDHEIPLQGKTVSGLHVWNNWRILPGAENMSKRNKWTNTETGPEGPVPIIAHYRAYAP